MVPQAWRSTDRMGLRMLNELINEFFRVYLFAVQPSALPFQNYRSLRAPHSVFDSPNCTFKLKLRPHWYPLELYLAMESNRRVHISYRVSGYTLGPDFVWKKPEHEWQTFVRALHYLAARKCDVPVWNVELH